MTGEPVGGASVPRSPHGGMVVGNPSSAREDCATICTGYRYFGLQWVDQCFCGNQFGSYGPSDQCGDHGAECANGAETCGSTNAVFDVAIVGAGR